jgi:cytochrome c-type biogenesis protein CcmI
VTTVLVIGVLALVAGVVVLRPLSGTYRQSKQRVRTSDESRRRELLRQLRDLDDDLAAGKLTEADHDRLAGPVAREAAAILRRGKGAAVAAKARRPAPRRGRRWILITLALGGGAVAVTFLLLGSVTPRTAGVVAAASASPAAAASGQQATPEQLAAVGAAAQAVKDNPKDVGAHLALAEAYAAGGANQLAAVEWLAVLKLDPANAEANTALAQLAYAVGHADQAKTMLDTALAAHPNYPEARYARGLILLVALHRPKEAEKDLKAYLAIAPFGAQRTQAETMLALAGGKGQ